MQVCVSFLTIHRYSDADAILPLTPANTQHLYEFDEGVGSALYKCYTNVLCLLGCIHSIISISGPSSFVSNVYIFFYTHVRNASISYIE